MSCLDYTTEDLAERNGANLLATQLQMLQRQHNEFVRRHYEELHRIRVELTHAERIGLRVIAANERGRKVIRVDSLIDEGSYAFPQPQEAP